MCVCLLLSVCYPSPFPSPHLFIYYFDSIRVPASRVTSPPFVPVLSSLSFPVMLQDWIFNKVSQIRHRFDHMEMSDHSMSSSSGSSSSGRSNGSRSRSHSHSSHSRTYPMTPENIEKVRNLINQKMVSAAVPYPHFSYPFSLFFLANHAVSVVCSSDICLCASALGVS